ncbi:putative oxidoreductase, glucose-methanol-choline family [Gordonia polyisoprenivorans VH2]|uniref:Putative oxidoreductase, glucose-methanol-choline family n=1 Tax=Gordonia polyisoprenivorans (strain DSM 44266 / VH2) TaxID=1112204 RepID=H6N1Y4_GORPV|nr:putative oxidoreductase, glucose-methanol-choline family [Gordonia polyisoprenivorans VH2]
MDETSVAGELPRRADVVIVGAGSAGSVLADTLSRDGTRSVLLLEQGSGWPDAAVRDLRTLPISASSGFVTVHDAPPGQTVVRGRGLGGSSAINGGYFLRWHRDDFAGWPSGWGVDDVEAAYRELDDADGPMSVHPFGEDDLGPAARAFERFWSTRVPVRDVTDRWPIIGLNRVLGNNAHRLRTTSAEAFLRPALARPNLVVRTGIRVHEILMAGRRATGLRETGSGGTDIACDEVILCAGTLGTAGILLRSIPEVIGPSGVLVAGEHREVLVGYRRRSPDDLRPLLPTVVHTDDGIEIRCYSDDFERYVTGSAGGSQAVGVCGMLQAGPARLTSASGGSVRVRFDDLNESVAAPLWATASDVVDMLASAEFDDVVVPDSISVDPVIRSSQHAFGSLPMGVRTDWLGGVVGVRGLRVVDGSILPSPGRSGPHATIMMTARRIGAALAAGY